MHKMHGTTHSHMTLTDNITWGWVLIYEVHIKSNMHYLQKSIEFLTVCTTSHLLPSHLGLVSLL